MASFLSALSLSGLGSESVGPASEYAPSLLDDTASELIDQLNGHAPEGWQLPASSAGFSADELLLLAAGAGSTEQVLECLQVRHADVNALCLPAVCTQCNPMRLLSSCTAAHCIGKETPLMSCALADRPEVMMLLLKHGAYPDIGNEVPWGT